MGSWRESRATAMQRRGSSLQREGAPGAPG